MKEDLYKGVVHEAGNGMADAGDYVVGEPDGCLYCVVDVGEIQTGRHPGSGNWQTATLRLADWSDIGDDEAEDVSCYATEIEPLQR